MKKVVISAAFIFTILTVCTLFLYIYTGLSSILSLSITFGTTAYHFLMRLAVGHAVNAVMHNCADYKRKWFRQKEFERMLYKALKVKSWKSAMPSYDPSLFSPELHTLDEIVQAMCQAEIVHEIIAVLSFLPVITIPMFGSAAVFIITSAAAACYDMLFVIMQRYNRPRIVKLISRGNHENISNQRKP